VKVCKQAWLSKPAGTNQHEDAAKCRKVEVNYGFGENLFLSTCMASEHVCDLLF